MTFLATASDRMARSRQVVDALLTAASAHAARADHGGAAALLFAAATVSRRRHTGRFVSTSLEDQLRALGAQIAQREELTTAPSPDARPPALAPEDVGRRVLHVMTRAWAAGGHTRLVERWIESEPDAVSSVVLTQSGRIDVPSRLVSMVERCGGAVHQLHGSLIERRRQLRALAEVSDRIVLSIHENDVVPALALAGMQVRPPVVILNHAEHVFWTGASLADVLVTMRGASTDLAVRRRGVSRASCVEIPLPVSAHVRRSQADARTSLNIPPADKVLVTVGWGYKYTPFDDGDIITALAPVLDPPDVHLLAVGPDAAEPMWSEARARYGGRVRACGRQETTRLFLDAADVFVDSYPIASLTAALEAAMSALPVVGLEPRTAAWPRILREDDPALVDAVFDDVGAYRDRIITLLRDPVERAAAGRALQERTARLHGAPAWKTGMERLRHALVSTRGESGASTRPGHTGRQLEFDHPAVEDAIVATYIADSEDAVIRPEIRLTSAIDGLDGPRAGSLRTGLERIDALLLKPGAAGADEYEEALRTACSLMPEGPTQ